MIITYYNILSLVNYIIEKNLNVLKFTKFCKVYSYK